MKRKYSTDELVKLYDDKDWATLWKIVTPMVKHAVRRCMREGLDPYYVRDDLMQEAYLAAWEALPRWNAFEAGLQTWIHANVRGAVLKANTREVTGMVGGRDNGGYVVSMHGESPDDDGSDDEQGLVAAPEALLVYKDAPEGFGDPAEEADGWASVLLSKLPAKYRDMVRRLCGLGVPAETQEEYARRESTTKKAVELRVRMLRQLALSNRDFLEGFSSKLGNQVTRGPEKHRSAA